MKTLEISYRKVKISNSPRGQNFHFSARVKRFVVYLKKMSPGGGISPRGEFHFAYV